MQRECKSRKQRKSKAHIQPRSLILLAWERRSIFLKKKMLNQYANMYGVLTILSSGVGESTDIPLILLILNDSLLAHKKANKLDSIKQPSIVSFAHSFPPRYGRTWYECVLVRARFAFCSFAFFLFIVSRASARANGFWKNVTKFSGNSRFAFSIRKHQRCVNRLRAQYKFNPFFSHSTLIFRASLVACNLPFESLNEWRR